MKVHLVTFLVIQSCYTKLKPSLRRLAQTSNRLRSVGTKNISFCKEGSNFIIMQKFQIRKFRFSCTLRLTQRPWAAFSRPRSQLFPLPTSKPAKNIYLSSKNAYHADWFSLRFEITRFHINEENSQLGEIMIPLCFLLRPRVFHQTRCFPHPWTPYHSPGTSTPRFPPSRTKAVFSSKFFRWMETLLRVTTQREFVRLPSNLASS